MFYRILLCFFMVCCVQVSYASQSPTKKDIVEKDPTKKVFDLERSVAILQLSSASVDDVQALQKQIDVLKQKEMTSERVDFLSNVVFLLVVIVLLLVWRVRRLSKQLAMTTLPFRDADNK